MYKADADLSWTYVEATTIGSTLITNLTPGIYYSFKIYASNKYGQGRDSGRQLRLLQGA